MPSISHAIVHRTSKHVKNWTLISLLSQLKQYRLHTAQRKKWEGIAGGTHHRSQEYKNGENEQNTEKNGGDDRRI
jgi:hypothetical protein